MLQDCDKCRKFATEITGEGVAPMTGPNNLNERIMKQKTIKKQEVWVVIEQWTHTEGIISEVVRSDIQVYATLDEAVQSWLDLSNHRNSREGCKVTPSDIEDYNSEDVLKRWYVYTNENGYTFLIYTIIARKYYYK